MTRKYVNLFFNSSSRIQKKKKLKETLRKGMGTGAWK
jgi:hypothetical protein